MATDGGSDGVAVAAARATLPANPYAKAAFNARQGGQQTINAVGALSAPTRERPRPSTVAARRNDGRRRSNESYGGRRKEGCGSLERAYALYVSYTSVSL